MAEDTGTEGFFQSKIEPVEESGEAKELDTSEETDEEEIEDKESESQESEEAEEEQEEDDLDQSVEDYRKLFEAAEEKRKKWQSRYDTDRQQSVSEISQLRNELNQLKEKQDGKEVDDIFAGKDDEDILTVGEAKRLKDKLSAKKVEQPLGDYKAWLSKQSDITEVEKYYSDLVKVEPNIDPSRLGADAKEQYLTLRTWMHEDNALSLKKEVELLRKQNEKIKKKKSRPKTPISGSGIGVSGGTRSGGVIYDIDPFFNRSWNK